MPTGPANRLLPALRRAVLGRQAAERSDGELVSAFVNKQDADSFAELVHRHGPMVLGVCRRVVGDPHTADDAFQAVFLVLARRAAAVRPRERVGNWLYGVAYRTAIKARAVLARRRSREKQVEAMPEPPVRPPADVWSDLQPVIDEELNRLPDKLRLPVVLCDLEGRPQRQVAARLRVPPATLATRLASARRLLADRLSRRGVTLSGGALAGLLGDRAAAAVVPPRLADAVVQAAEAAALGAPVSTLVSAHAVQLSEGVMRMMLVAKLKAVGAAALTILALTGGLGLGLVPAHAGDEPAIRVVVQPASAPGNTNPQPRPDVDDATFLNRLSLDLRGTSATPLEMLYFVADPDPNKRAKVIDWLLADDAVKAHLAKKLNVPAERIVIVRLDRSGVRYLSVKEVIELALDENPQPASVTESLALGVKVNETRTGEFLLGAAVNSDSGVSGVVVVNERTFDLIRLLPVDDPQNANRVRVWDVKTGKQVLVAGQDSIWVDGRSLGIRVYLADEPQPRVQYSYQYDVTGLGERLAPAESDAEFLKRVLMSARGTPPTAVEEKYFTEDKDPQKREKLLDALLKDPEVAKKVGDDWKKKMLAPPTVTYTYRVHVKRPATLYDTGRLWVYEPAPDPQEQRLAKLVDELLAANKPDDQVLDGITLAVVGRLPTESEKKLTLAAVSKAADRKAAWLEVARALAATDEAKKHSGK